MKSRVADAQYFQEGLKVHKKTIKARTDYTKQYPSIQLLHIILCNILHLASTADT